MKKTCPLFLALIIIFLAGLAGLDCASDRKNPNPLKTAYKQLTWGMDKKKALAMTKGFGGDPIIIRGKASEKCEIKVYRYKWTGIRLSREEYPEIAELDLGFFCGDKLNYAKYIRRIGADIFENENLKK